MKKLKNKDPNKKGTIRNRIICMAMLLIILSTACGGCTSSVEDYFVKYEGATTLVEVRYGEPTFWGYKGAVGFIDNDIYEKYMNSEYEGKIQLYHPYKEGESVTVDTKTIVSITLHTYDSFYEEYSPSTYAH